MTEISYKHQPTFNVDSTKGRPIKAVEISRDSIFITDENNRVYHVWLNWDETLPVLVEVIKP
jgi:hypothetical protein